MQFHAKSANAKLSSFSSFTEPDSSLFHRRYSIDTPSMVHRFDGETMVYRWTSDGGTAEHLRKISEKYPEENSFIYIHS